MFSVVKPPPGSFRPSSHHLFAPQPLSAPCWTTSTCCLCPACRLTPSAAETPKPKLTWRKRSASTLCRGESSSDPDSSPVWSTEAEDAGVCSGSSGCTWGPTISCSQTTSEPWSWTKTVESRSSPSTDTTTSRDTSSVEHAD